MEEVEIELKERRQKRRAFYSGLHRSKPEPKKEVKEKRVKECGFKKRNNNTNILSGKKRRKELGEIIEGVVSSSIVEVKEEIKEKDEYKFVKIIDASECSPTASLPKIKPKSYKDGAEGMIKWCNDFVRIPIYPEGSDMAEWVALKDLPDDPNPRTKKSSKQFWENIQAILRQALIMENGRFVHRLVVLCWMRGEAKSLVACLIQLWKFFNWPRQQIMLGANSKDQVKFVHFDIIRDIILNSPDLLFMIGGERNIQEKEVRIVDEQGHVKSMIRSISSFSGIVSNITGYTFSEIFDMKNPKFFVQLDGSIRNIPNALGVIDSTVSAKDHILYRLYTNYISNKTSTVFFSYRYSRKGVQEDYWNPNMDNAQLDDYRTKFPFGEFERYFLNMWNAGGLKVFNEEMFFETNVIGADGYQLNHETIQQILDDRKKSVDVLMDLQEKKRDNFDATRSIDAISSKIKVYENRLQLVDSVYQLKDSYSRPKICTAKTLCAIGDMFKTDFSIHVGLDLSDPFAKKHRARSIVTCIAKGLPNSRDNIFSSSMDAMSPRYIYFLLALDSSEMYADKSLDRIKDFLEELDMEYDGLDTLCSERYGAWDMAQWCEERNVTFEPVHPNYERQKEAFNELYLIIDQGRFKSPKLIVPGTKDNNILKEELLMFDHDSQLKWFGSPEKADSHGVQDDSVFSLMWCIYGGRFTTSDQFRMRNSEARDFGTFMQTEKLIGRY